jgi:hypothetical protein
LLFNAFGDFDLYPQIFAAVEYAFNLLGVNSNPIGFLLVVEEPQKK